MVEASLLPSRRGAYRARVLKGRVEVGSVQGLCFREEICTWDHSNREAAAGIIQIGRLHLGSFK